MPWVPVEKARRSVVPPCRLAMEHPLQVRMYMYIITHETNKMQVTNWCQQSDALSSKEVKLAKLLQT